MDEMQRLALEQEFDEKSAQLSEMMQQMPQMQEAYRQYEAAVRAIAVKTQEIAAKEEKEEAERMLARCQKAQSALEAATAAGDKARMAQCQETCEAEKLAYELAERRMQEAFQRFEAEKASQRFETEDEYRAAFMAKPAFDALEKKLTPFRQAYAQLLARCEEIEKLLSAGEDA